jgi:hypothetical protein
MKIKTQEQFIREQLEKKGSISRNFCLSRFISRLGAHINRLRNSGMEISGGYVSKNGGRDYVYKLVK